MRRQSLRHLSIALLTTMASVAAFANGGADIGGGLGLVCFKSQRIADHVFHQNGRMTDRDIASIVSVTPIDLADAAITAPENSELISALKSETHQKYTDRLIELVAHEFPTFAENIQQTKEKLSIKYVNKSLRLMSDAELPDDWNKNNRCTVVTLAVQNRQNITVDQRLFAKMKTTEQGILMLHEYIYYIGRQTRGHRSSLGTRKVVKHVIYNDLNARKELAEQTLIEFGFLKGE